MNGTILKDYKRTRPSALLRSPGRGGAVVYLIVALGILGCGKERVFSDSDTLQPPGGQADRPASSVFVVDETGLKATPRVLEANTAQSDHQGLIVTVPLELFATSSIEVSVTLSLTPLDSVEGPSIEERFTLAPGQQEVVIDLDTPLPESQTMQATSVLRYRISGGGGEVSGARSLFHILGKLGLQVWAPVQVDAGQATAVRVWVKDLVSGVAPEEVVVTLNGESRDADASGQVSFEVVAPTDAESMTLQLFATDGEASVALARSIEVVPEGAPKVYVSTDKPLYRPGQTMHIRAMALQAKDLKPLEATPITLEVLDGKQNKIFKHEAITDAFGIAALTAPLAAQVNTGVYTVRAVTEAVTHVIEVEVSEEKLPKFALAVALDRPWFSPGETITGVVDAQYFFGKSVVGADVEIAIEGAGSGRPNAFVGKTDQAGLMTFELPGGATAPGVNATVVVTDTAGFQVVKRVNIVVATPQLFVQLIPESSAVPETRAWRLFVQTRGVLGGPVSADCEVDGVDGETFSTDASGLAVIEVSGAYVSVSCSTADGVRGDQALFHNDVDDRHHIMVRADRAIYAPGDAMVLQVEADPSVEVAYIDCIHRGRIVGSHTVELIDGEGSVELVAGEGKDGTLHFVVSHAAEDGALYSATQVAYVRRPGANVRVTTDADLYAPGGEAELTFEVLDDEGVGRAAAIGVTIADEAVFALAATSGSSVVEALTLSDTPSGVRPFILSETQQAEQLAARVALAASPMPNQASAEGLTQMDLQWQVRNVVNPMLNQIRSRLRDTLQSAADEGRLNVEQAEALLNDLVIYDYWGQAFVLSAEGYEDTWSNYAYVKIASRGPDELPETWDDYKSGFSLYFQHDESGSSMGASPSSMDEGAYYDSSGSEPGDYDPREGDAGPSSGAEAPKKRDDFPETLYVNPALITDSAGRATVTLPLADVITNWRVSMVANTQGGLVSSGLGAITVFQDFFVDADLPRKLTEGDELALPIGVFNFSDVEQVVTVTVEDASWLEFKGEPSQVVTVPAGGSASVPFEVVVGSPGRHELEVLATSPSFGDAIGKMVHVIPNGQVINGADSGPLESELNATVTFPSDALEGGNDALLKLMGGPSGQVIDGVEALLRSPRGCFEPMMNSTWINALVLDYMAWTGSGSPALEQTARANLQDGIQQSITFECTGGGFTWFGDPDPAHPILTAFALVMFEDIAASISVDGGLVTRSIDFVEGQQRPDGSWDTTQHTKNQVMPWDSLRTTCVVADGLAASGRGDAGALGSAVAYIDDNMNQDADTYTLAMCTKALLNAAPGEAVTDVAVTELLARAQVEGGITSWDSDYPGVSNAGGEVIQVETTALAAQALFAMDAPPMGVLGGAMKFLASMKSPDGNFRSTQGTIQAMRAFVAAAKFAAGEVDVTVQVLAGDDVVYETQINADNREVVHFVSLSEYASGDIPLTVQVEGEGKLYYQLTNRHFRSWSPTTRRVGPNMDIDVTYAPTTFPQDAFTVASLRVVNNGSAIGPGDMPMVDFGVPPGFDADLTELDHKVLADPNVARYELKGERIWIYLHEVSANPEEAFEVDIRLRPRFPMKVTAPSARAWEFFKPDQYSESLPVELTVTALN